MIFGHKLSGSPLSEIVANLNSGSLHSVDHMSSVVWSAVYCDDTVIFSGHDLTDAYHIVSLGGCVGPFVQSD